MTKLILGIDGGGSKTDILLCDESLNQIARLVVGRSNPNDIGIKAVEKLIYESVSLLLSENGINKNDVVAAFAGIAGLTNPDYAQRIKRVLSMLLPNAKVDALHDGINVLYGAFPESDGVSVICGTGSSCFVKKGDEIFRIGGYNIFDMAGNGYEIGRYAIAHALKTVDGREQRGLMEDLIEKKLGKNVLDALGTLCAMSKDELASFAPLVLEAAEKGDKSAMCIIYENVYYIAELIFHAGEYFDGDYNVALAGGIFKNYWAYDLLTGILSRGNATLVKSDRAPSFGAAAKAKSLL